VCMLHADVISTTRIVKSSLWCHQDVLKLR
jgi:hypothetical protein